MIAPGAWVALAFAHGDADATANAPAWTFDAGVTVPLALALVAFAIGYLRLQRRARRAPARRETALYLAGWCVLAGALVSPLHRAGERSFALHMLEHELLMLVAAPLLVAAHAHGVLLWSLPQRARAATARWLRTRGVARAWRWLSDPLVATALQAIALCVWHAPPLFDRALRSNGWHIAQHVSFLVAALLFWSAMFEPRRRRTRPMTIVACLFATTLIGAALGALMAFSSSPWYSGYRALGLGAFGLSAVDDQQIAGLLMWIPGGALHMALALALFADALRRMERSDAH